MRIFNNTKEAYPEILRDIVKRGVEYHSSSVQGKDTKNNDDYTFRELVMYGFCITDPSDAVENSKDPIWVQAEFQERVDPKCPNPGSAFRMREELWSPMLNEYGQFDYNYSQRMQQEKINHLVSNIKNMPSSRQNILSIWNDIDHSRIGTNKRVPCSMYYNFRERNGKVDIIYHMRSSDYYEHFRNDIALAYLLLKYIATLSGKEVGSLYMTIDSLHAYKKDWGKLEIY